MHYRRWKKTGNTDLPVKVASPPIPCAIAGCERPKFCRGWCRMHYARWHQTGSTELGVRPSPAPPPKASPRPLEERFWPKVQKSDEGCWLWLGGKTRLGYGVIWSLEERRQLMAHRVSWELASTERIGPNLVIDHLCRNPSCVRPDHLEVVTVAENTRRGDAPRLGAARQLAKTHCPQGHPYAEENTYVYASEGGGSRRVCRTCAITRTQQRRLAKG